MTVIVTRAAHRDLDEIFSYIAVDNIAAATRTIEHLFAVARQLDEGELRGPEVHRPGHRSWHWWSVPPYRIYYRRTTNRTVILRVYHQARRPLG